MKANPGNETTERQWSEDRVQFLCGRSQNADIALTLNEVSSQSSILYLIT